MEFVAKIKDTREEYINQVITIALGDPKLSNLEKVLSSWTEKQEQVTVVQPPGPPAVIPLPTETEYPVQAPDKQPMKGTRRVVYGRCPNCNSVIFEAGSKFCSQCATPLDIF